MSEILSQSQIDSLLSSLLSGNKENEPAEQPVGKKIKDYDFRSPKLFTREQLKLLYSIYENFARIVSSHVTGMLQTYTLVEIVEVEEQQYHEFNNALPDSVLMGIVDFDMQQEGQGEDLILMDISKDIGFCTIDRLLGGTGKPLKEDREYTEIETAILEHVIRGVVGLMRNVWADYVDVAPKLMKLESNARILQGISADENVVIVVMNMLVNETQGKITICIPAVTLDTIFKKKNAQSKKSVRRGDLLSEAQRRAAIMEEIRKTELEITGVLGTAQVLSRDLVELEVGDIIRLNKDERDMVELCIGGTAWFKGEMGVFRKKKAISIKEKIQKGSGPV